MSRYLFPYEEYFLCQAAYIYIYIIESNSLTMNIFNVKKRNIVPRMRNFKIQLKETYFNGKKTKTLLLNKHRIFF